MQVENVIELSVNKTKVHPGWKEAAIIISRRTYKEGHGLLFSHQELEIMMDIKKENPENQFEWMDHIFRLKHELLVHHNMHLWPSKGQGYTVLHPNDQVIKVPDSNFKKIRRCLSNTMKTLTHVTSAKLDTDQAAVREHNMNRAAFLHTQMNKRRIPLLKDKKLLSA